MIQKNIPAGHGFTLIELVIAIAVLAIIVGIAIPSYTAQVTKTHRTEGKSELLQIAQALERCYTRFSRYDDTANCPIANTLSGGGNQPTENGHYLITAPTLTATQFTLNAARQGSQATRDKWCGTFTLTHTGQKGMTGTAEWDATRCWN